MTGSARAVSFLLIALVVFSAAAVPAQEPAGSLDPEIRRTHSRLVSELMSPFCHGLTLENCPTSGASEMRDQILAWLVEGRTESWILDTLVDEWGETILGAPRFSGIGIIAWVAPGVLLLAAGLWMVLWLRRSVGAPAVPAGDAGEVPAEDRQGSHEALLRQVDREVGALLE